jgi:cell division protein FtsB
MLMAFITFLFLRGTYIVFQKKVESAAYVSALSQKAEDLEKKRVELTANIASLETESGLEKEVKAKYNVAKEGEHVVILVDKSDEATNTAPEDPPWMKKFWNAIMSAL